jgi:hypothetical protein
LGQAIKEISIKTLASGSTKLLWAQQRVPPAMQDMQYTPRTHGFTMDWHEPREAAAQHDKRVCHCQCCFTIHHLPRPASALTLAKTAA